MWTSDKWSRLEPSVSSDTTGWIIVYVDGSKGLACKSGSKAGGTPLGVLEREKYAPASFLVFAMASPL